MDMQEVSGKDAGLTQDEQIRIALEVMVAAGGSATMEQIYKAVEVRMGSAKLSDRPGKSSLRFFINTRAVEKGFVYKYDREYPKQWRVTPEGREYLRMHPLQAMGPQSVTVQDGDVGYPEFFEGALFRVTVNAYERNPRARATCLKEHGRRCAVCAIDLAAVYGPAAQGVIHVHHLKPLKDIGHEYEVDPIKDLRPVCPNCHTVIHRHDPPFSIEEVEAMLKVNRAGRSKRANRK